MEFNILSNLLIVEEISDLTKLSEIDEKLLNMLVERNMIYVLFLVRI